MYSCTTAIQNWCGSDPTVNSSPLVWNGGYFSRGTGSTAVLSCQPNYTPYYSNSAPYTVTCLATGAWSAASGATDCYRMFFERRHGSHCVNVAVCLNTATEYKAFGTHECSHLVAIHLVEHDDDSSDANDVGLLRAMVVLDDRRLRRALPAALPRAVDWPLYLLLPDADRQRPQAPSHPMGRLLVSTFCDYKSSEGFESRII